MKILELFGGIGACTQVLKRLGIPFEVADYVEIDKYAVKSYNAINGTNFEPQDITKWDKDIDVDLIMHGSPCQDFSIAGKQAGGDEDSGTRSSLMYETIRIVESLHPKYVVWENVKNLLSKKHRHNFDAYLEELNQLGYNNYYQVLNAKDYGIPQNRKRVYTISIRKDIDNGTFTFPEKEELKLRLKDMLEDEVDEKYYLSDSMIKYISQTGTANFKNHDSRINLDIARLLTTDQNKRAGTTNYLSEDLSSNYNLMDMFNNKVEEIAFIEKGTGQHQSNTSLNASMLLIKSGAYARNFGSRGKIQNKDYSDTLVASMGTGGGNVPLVPQVIGGIGEKKSNGGTQWYQQDRIYDNNVGLSVSTTAIPYYPDNQLRIRKLTPKECWRLMGFSDECFEKAQKVNSNAQLYKQAGNSIVVDVLYKIFKNLFNMG